MNYKKINKINIDFSFKDFIKLINKLYKIRTFINP